jgi:hypothetical protein
MNVSIDGQKQVELMPGQPEQVAVLAACPTHFWNRHSDVVPDQISFRRLDGHASGRIRTCEQGVFGLLGSGYRLLPAHGRKIVEKLRKRIASFEVIEQRLKRHTCADEHRRAAHDLGVAAHNGLLLVDHRCSCCRQNTALFVQAIYRAATSNGGQCLKVDENREGEKILHPGLRPLAVD